jgi:hypothetical protein
MHTIHYHLRLCISSKILEWVLLEATRAMLHLQLNDSLSEAFRELRIESDNEAHPEPAVWAIGWTDGLGWLAFHKFLLEFDN